MDGRMREFLFNDAFLVQFIHQVLLLVIAHALAVYSSSCDSSADHMAATHFSDKYTSTCVAFVVR
jgi:hypothetical protein